jgi:adenylate cyclase
VAEDITTELSRFRGLFVVARNSAFIYCGQAIDVRCVSRDLGLRYIVEGGVRGQRCA